MYERLDRKCMKRLDRKCQEDRKCMKDQVEYV